MTATAGTVRLSAGVRTSGALAERDVASELMVLSLALVIGFSVCFAWTAADWIEPACEGAVFACGLALLGARRGKRPGIPFSRSLCLLAVLPLTGCLQLVLRRAAYPFAAVEGALYWTAAASLAMVGGGLFESGRCRALFASGLLWLGSVATVLEVIQIFSFHRFELTSTGYPLLSSSHYAELMELIFPAVVFRGFRKGSGSWVYLMMAAVFFATVLASAARMGSVLVTAEAGVLLMLAFRRKLMTRKRLWRYTTILIVLVTMLTAFEGTEMLRTRLKDADPLRGRADIYNSTLAMIGNKPLMGSGLGSFPTVYRKYARFDNGYLVNHAHNDYLEFAAEGGFICLTILILFFIVVAPVSWRSGSGIGVFATFVHMAFDFPMYRFSVMAVFMLVASGAMARDRSIRGTARRRFSTVAA